MGPDLSCSRAAKPRQLTSDSEAEFSPAWAPDGQSAVYGSFPDNSKPLSIRSVEIATGVTTPVPGSEGLYSPSWSPDGRYLVAHTPDFRGMLYDFTSRRWVRLIERAANSFAFTRDSAFLQYDTGVYGEKDVAVFRMRLSDRRVERIGSFAGRFTSSNQSVWTGVAEDGSPLATVQLAQ